MEQKINTPKEVFLNLLAILALYFIAGNFIALIFQYIDITFKDPLYAQYYESVFGTIRFAMASLIIVFPAFMFISHLIAKNITKEPELRALKFRRWLLYFTLFIGAGIMIGDLVTLVYNLLEGEFTIKFITKVKTVFGVSATIFYYYLHDLRGSLSNRAMRYFGVGSTIVICAAIIGGFFTVGSPLNARLYRLDERRINDLQTLQNEITNYWSSHNEQLPKKIEDLNDDISGFTAPQDPVTNAAYEYSIKTSNAFELCAQFALSSKLFSTKSQRGLGPYSENWDHEATRTCFSRTIDPLRYRKELPRY